MQIVAGVNQTANSMPLKGWPLTVSLVGLIVLEDLSVEIY